MNKVKLLLLGLLSIGLTGVMNGHLPAGKSNKKTTVSTRGGDCARANSQTDQAINNVRARLLTGGDVWWDGDNGRYIVPKVPAGQPEVSSVFAGAVWLGGKDPAGNLKVAVKAYGTSSSQTDFYPGPLDAFTGGVDRQTCANWDRFFKVTADEIRLHLSLFAQSLQGEIDYTEEMIPAGVKSWPSTGNPYFAEIWNFELPSTGQGLAAYFDENEDGLYDPLDGDYPIIEIRDCTDWDEGDLPQFPDEMIFWIYNDNGGPHTESNADPIQMEIQVQAFAYATNDFVNDMTFQRYKLINRAIEDIRETYFAMWVDPDLGCYTDDYVGCDTSRSLAYVYNQDAADGQTGCSCPQGVNTYCTNIPILGVDYFRGPRGNVPMLDDNGDPVIDPLTGDTVFMKIELGMSSFTYYNNGSVGGPNPATTDPDNAQEYYNYITGRWKDGSPFTFGGDGYNTGDPIDFAFPSPPNCGSSDCWSMCSASLGEGDRRTLQATGPFTLKPGDVNELIVGVVWIPEVDYPCPDISLLQKADDVAQALFDNCFDITDGPDAPDVDWIELDRKVIGVLTNDTDPAVTNNVNEEYEEIDLQAPESLPEEQRQYRFEGYKVFQLADASVSVTELNDPSQARLVFQSDIDNGIGHIYNWEAVANPVQGQPAIWVPTERVLTSSPDQGIRHTFQVVEDQFSTSQDRRLINHKKYYFMALAYAHNNWEQFDPFAGGGQGAGQPKPYLEGRNNIQVYTVIPRPITDLELNAEYGDQDIEITRLDGVGTGGHFLDITDETRQAIEDGTFDGTITYKAGNGPFEVIVFNPLLAKGGRFQLTLFDENMGNSTLDDEVKWRLTNLDNPDDVFESQTTIDELNERILPEYGFSVVLRDGREVGNNRNGTGHPRNGGIGVTLDYTDELGQQWLSGQPDDPANVSILPPLPPSPDNPDGVPGISFISPFNYVQTGPNEPDEDIDPTSALSTLGDGFFMPYYVLHFQQPVNSVVSPVWFQHGSIVRNQSNIAAVNNVDIVFTSDKSLWSRCVIVETTSPAVRAAGFATVGSANHFDLRQSQSVGKEDADGDGLPDPDGSGTMGMGWFPGYAIDVETGQRLNIFFGEASIYRCDEPLFTLIDACNSGILDNPTGADMMWNPTDQELFRPPSRDFNLQLGFLISGGMHFIYVSNTPYDECATIRSQFTNANPLFKTQALRNVTWAGFPLLAEGATLNSYADGLIPNELVAKLRVDNPFAVSVGTGVNNGYPTYEFTLEDIEARAITEDFEFDEALEAINVVPNPYYGFSAYENSAFSTVVKITNLPAKCTVTIYTLDGKFIRQYIRDEVGEELGGNNRALERRQIIPDLEWDLKNNKGIPVAAGIYLIHVDAPGYGERVLKWFGIPRQYDPSGL